MKNIFTLLLTLSVISSAQIKINNIFENKSEIYFSFEISDLRELNTLTNIISLDNIKGKTVFAYANQHEFEEFIKFNYSFEILPNPSTLIIPEMSGLIEDITNWNVYPTYDVYVNLMYQFQTNYPQICKIIDAGNTVQGRKILFAKISDNIEQREAEPQFMYTSTMHGDETTGYVLMLRLIDSLLSSYGNDSRITNMINNSEIWINPLANPDGTYRSGNNTVSGATRYNFNNYDLNRNFPDPLNGINPNQQIETTRFRAIQEANNFSLIANIHGGAEVINYPWDRWSNVGSNSKTHVDEPWYIFISRMYADTAQYYSPSGYMTYLNNGTTNGGAWYVITGGRQDYTNFYRHGREVTIEISNTKLPPASQLPAFWEFNKTSFLNYMERIFYGINGVVTDNLGNPIRAKITILNHDADSSEIYSDISTGHYLRMIQPGTYTLKFQAPGYSNYVSQPIQIANYNSSVNLNVQLEPTNPIPVELNSFSAFVNNYDVHLSWSTATETNNRGFEIQRSVIPSGARNLSWEVAGFVNGKGTTTEPNNYSFVDKNLPLGKFTYRLKQIDLEGTTEYSNEIEVEIISPIEFVLEQNYPNPFNPSTKIRFFISASSLNPFSKGEGTLVTLKVYDILGNEVVTLINEEKLAGSYEVTFDASSFPSGTYFYRLMAGNFSKTKSMLFLK